MGGEEDNPNDLPYRSEYAKSGRAKCKGCKVEIPKGDLRLASMTQVFRIDPTYIYNFACEQKFILLLQSPFFDGKQANWFHSNCFFMRNRCQLKWEIC